MSNSGLATMCRYLCVLQTYSEWWQVLVKINAVELYHHTALEILTRTVPAAWECRCHWARHVAPTTRNSVHYATWGPAGATTPLKEVLQRCRLKQAILLYTVGAQARAITALHWLQYRWMATSSAVQCVVDQNGGHIVHTFHYLSAI